MLPADAFFWKYSIFLASPPVPYYNKIVERQNKKGEKNMNQQPEVYRSPALAEDTSPLSVGSYLVMLIVSAIPLVGLIMMFVWGFGHSNRNRKNFARASLILTAVGIVIFVLFYSTFAAMLAGAYSAS